MLRIRAVLAGTLPANILLLPGLLDGVVVAICKRVSLLRLTLTLAFTLRRATFHIDNLSLRPPCPALVSPLLPLQLNFLDADYLLLGRATRPISAPWPVRWIGPNRFVSHSRHRARAMARVDWITPFSVFPSSRWPSSTNLTSRLAGLSFPDHMARWVDFLLRPLLPARSWPTLPWLPSWWWVASWPWPIMPWGWGTTWLRQAWDTTCGLCWPTFDMLICKKIWEKRYKDPSVALTPPPQF